MVRPKIIEKNAHDFAEAEGDDGQIIAAQFQRRRTKQYAEECCQRRADRQDDPEGKMQAELR